MTKEKLTEMKHEELVEKAWSYWWDCHRKWRNWWLALMVLALGIGFSVWLSPVFFNLISKENYANLNKTILWSGIFVVLIRALVIVFAMHTVIKIVSSEE